MDKDLAYRTTHYRQGAHFIKEMTFASPTALSTSQTQLLHLSTVRHSHLCYIHSVSPCSSLTLQCYMELLPYSLKYIAACYTASPWDERGLVCHFLALIDALARLQRQDIAHMRISLDHLMVNSDLSTVQLISFESNTQLYAGPEGRFRRDVWALGMCFLRVAYIGQDLETAVAGGEEGLIAALEGLKSYESLRKVLDRALEMKADALTFMREFGAFSLCTDCIFCQNRQQTWPSTLGRYPVIASPAVKPRHCKVCKRLLDKIGEEQATTCAICLVRLKPASVLKTDHALTPCTFCNAPCDPLISSSHPGLCSDECVYNHRNSLQSRCQYCGSAFTPAPNQSPDYQNFCSENCGVNYTVRLSQC